ncbi:hypothetical protein ABK040_007329 [Willaertia magna]
MTTTTTITNNEKVIKKTEGDSIEFPEINNSRNEYKEDEKKDSFCGEMVRNFICCICCFPAACFMATVILCCNGH